MSKTVEKLIITRTGQARGLVGPLVDRVTRQLGQRTTRRASHVEPTEELSATAIDWLARQPGHLPEECRINRRMYTTEELRAQLPADRWWADMAPSCPGGLVLGPFTTNTEALAAERAWLLDHDIPTVGN